MFQHHFSGGKSSLSFIKLFKQEHRECRAANVTGTEESGRECARPQSRSLRLSPQFVPRSQFRQLYHVRLQQRVQHSR